MICFQSLTLAPRTRRNTHKIIYRTIVPSEWNYSSLDGKQSGAEWNFTGIRGRRARLWTGVATLNQPKIALPPKFGKSAFGIFSFDRRMCVETILRKTMASLSHSGSAEAYKKKAKRLQRK